MLLSFNDICIVPSVISEVEHRSECSPFNHDGMLPLFTAPMSSVINEQNWTIFHDNKINTIIPRSVDFEVRKLLMNQTFVAVSLKEFEELINTYYKDETVYICVDIANGHMKKLLDLCEKAKTMYGNRMQVMAGNIANPDTYLKYAAVGIDYVRIGIGGGSCCTTSSNVGGIHYPMVSLLQNIRSCQSKVVWSFEHDDKEVFCYPDISKTYIHKNAYKSIPKIIADGGFNNFDQIIKALAIGADYVMLGKIFAMSEEACGEEILNYSCGIRYIPSDLLTDSADLKKAKIDIACLPYGSPIRMRKYYGMSTKKAQTEISGEAYKTAEGIETLVPIKYTLAGWCDNFMSYLRSAMSYCNSRTLDQFRENVKIREISNNSFNAYYK